jgi:hypothetical protein
MAGIPLPKAMAISAFVRDTGPSYTQIFNDTMGNLATPSDGFDPALSAIGALGDSLAAELAAETAKDTVGTAIGIYGGIDPTVYDLTLQGYSDLAIVGAGHITALESQTPPPILELPMSITFDGGIGAAPTQSTVDLGTVKLGSAPIDSTLGNWATHPDGTVIGITSAWVGNSTGGKWTVLSTYAENNNGFARGIYYVEFTPNAVGSFQAQVNVLTTVKGTSAITTFKVTVIP